MRQATVDINVHFDAFIPAGAQNDEHQRQLYLNSIAERIKNNFPGWFQNVKITVEKCEETKS